MNEMKKGKVPLGFIRQIPSPEYMHSFSTIQEILEIHLFNKSSYKLRILFVMVEIRPLGLQASTCNKDSLIKLSAFIF